LFQQFSSLFLLHFFSIGCVLLFGTAASNVPANKAQYVADGRILMKITDTFSQRTLTLAPSLLALTIALGGLQSQAQAQGTTPDIAGKTQETPTGRVAWNHVGRVFVNPSNGQFVYAGYLVHIGGIDSSLFNGSPSESTAYFTFSTDVAQLTPLPNNGDVALDLVSAGTFSVYYNAKPGGDWSNPASFSSGRLIATFQRKESLFPQIGPISFHSLSETLISSHSFEFDGQTWNFKCITPQGITFAQFFSTAPRAGTAEYPVTFSGAGTVTAVGDQKTATE
jgi:hypothetical protein